MFFGCCFDKRAIAGQLAFDPAMKGPQVDVIKTSNISIVFIVNFIKPTALFDGCKKGIDFFPKLMGFGMHGPAELL